MDIDYIPPQLETTYEWEIENFCMFPHSIGECLRSNIFYLDSVDVSEYQLVLYPRGRMKHIHETPVCLLECHKESDFRIDVTMAIAFEDKEMEMKREKVLMTIREPLSFEIERLKKPQENPKFALLPGDLFTIRCTITLVYDPETDVQDLVALSEDLESLYRTQWFSDFCLVNSEGHRYPVHKIVLMARCPDLAKKLGIFDSADCNEGRLLATPVALDVFLEYVYAGRLRCNVDSEVLNEVHSIAVQNDMDDLKREIFPLQICEAGRTVIRVDHQDVRWDMDEFRVRVDQNDWPSSTLIDLVVGRIFASFSVVDATTAQVEMKCWRFSLGRPFTVKCLVHVFTVFEESSSLVLCEGEHRFHPEDPTNVFRLQGDLAFYLRHGPVPDLLPLVFDFRVSYPRNESDRCNNVESINALGGPHPIWKRSLHRLSADLDTAYKDTYEGCDSGWWTHSDLRMGIGSGPVIPVHRSILSTRSNSLRSLINNNNNVLASDGTPEIHLPFINLPTVHHVMRYVYSGKLSPDVKIVTLIPVYLTSVQHRLTSLAERCLQLIQRKAELRHLKHLLALSDNLPLRMVAFELASRVRDKIQNTPEWKEIVREMPVRASRFLMDVISAPDSTTDTY